MEEGKTDDTLGFNNLDKVEWEVEQNDQNETAGEERKDQRRLAR